MSASAPAATASPFGERPEPALDARETPVAALGALFGLSGAAALVYQVAWQRILALHSGVGIYSVTLIVAAFMAGLGLGSELGGVASARVTPRAALRAFALIELAVAAFAALSGRLYYDVLYLRAAWLYTPLWRAAILHLAALLPPTTLMGMSLPFLVRATVREEASAGRVVGFLYGVNVLGASLGALATPWLLIRHFGIAGALGAGAAASACAGVFALALVGRVVGPSMAAVPRAPFAARPLREWMALYALSGFCALSLEIAWFRVMDVAVKSTAFTFGSVLAVYLACSAAGSLLGARWVGRLRDPRAAFLLVQCALLACAAAAVVALVRLPAGGPLAWYAAYWARPDGLRLGRVWDAPSVARLYFALPAVLYGLPTLLMGAAFPILQRAVHDDARTSGRKVGFLQAANIAGCVAGALLVGLVALDRIGTAGTLRAVTACGLVFAALGARERSRRALFALAAAALLVALALLPSEERLWRRLHGVDAGPVLFDEDATSVVALTPDPGAWRLSVDGTWNSSIPYGSVHTWLGAIPAVVHPAPVDVAVIGLGSGDTAWGASCRKETRLTRVFEICSPERRILEELALREPQQTQLGALLRDPRLRFVVADGRHAIQSEADRYDVIEADALRPYHAGSGNLYSLEFFVGCARALKQGGIMCSWAPTPRTYETFVQAFPYVLDFGNGQILLGSNEPVPVDLPAWMGRLRTPHLVRYLGGEIAGQIRERLRTAHPVARGLRSERVLNRDMFPRDEFAAPR